MASVFASLRIDPSSVIGWLEKFGPGVLAALLGAAASAMLVTWFQERRRARREHLEAIKAQGLRPLHEKLGKFYLPLLRGEIGPVTLDNVVIPLEGSVTQRRTTWEWRLAPRRKYELQPFPFASAPEQASEMSLELYEDAKRCHYRKLIRQIEAFKAEVESYTAEWMSYAEQLSRVIAERTGLPVVTGDSANTEPSWVNTNGLAVFVLDWQLGATPHSPIPDYDRGSLEIGGWTMARAKTREAIQHTIEVLDDLSHERQTVEGLRRRAEPLVLQATALLGKLNQPLLSSKLPGRCQLAKV